jgi:hypothetical protein
MAIKIKLDVSKIPKSKIFIGQKGKYLDLILVENKNGTDQYGQDGFVSVDTTKEERESGVKGVIVGNWKHLGQKPQSQQPPQRQPAKPATPPPRPPADPDLDGPQDCPF